MDGLWRKTLLKWMISIDLGVPLFLETPIYVPDKQMAFPSATFKKVANLSQAWWQSICQAGFNEQPAVRWTDLKLYQKEGATFPGGGWWWLQRFFSNIFTP